MENESNISLGGTIIYLLSLRKNTSLGKDTFWVDPPTQSEENTASKMCVCEIQRDKVLELENATLRALIGSLFLTRLLYSIVWKEHKTNAK